MSLSMNRCAVALALLGTACGPKIDLDDGGDSLGFGTTSFDTYGFDSGDDLDTTTTSTQDTGFGSSTDGYCDCSPDEYCSPYGECIPYGDTNDCEGEYCPCDEPSDCDPGFYCYPESGLCESPQLSTECPEPQTPSATRRSNIADAVALLFTDYNNDGTEDLIVVRTNTYTAFLGPDFSTFVTTNPSPPGIIDAVADDMNGDGVEDLVFTTNTSTQIWLHANIVDSTEYIDTEDHLSTPLVDLQTGDFNGDDITDIAGRRADTQTIALAFGNGTGFESLTEQDPGTIEPIAFLNFDDDAFDDLAIRAGVYEVQLYGNAAGDPFVTSDTLSNPAPGATVMLAADVDDNGNEELVSLALDGTGSSQIVHSARRNDELGVARVADEWTHMALATEDDGTVLYLMGGERVARATLFDTPQLFECIDVTDRPATTGGTTITGEPTVVGAGRTATAIATSNGVVILRWS